MAATRERDFLTIGEVLRQLGEEFPDLSISKIRYLEDQGIIAPERTGGGYRKFTATDVTRLRLALRLQRDHFLPLHVIRERLRESDRLQFGEQEPGQTPILETIALPLDDKGQASLEDVVRSVGVTQDFIRSLAGFGLIDIKASEDGKVLDKADVEIVRAAHDMTRYGLEPRHLRMYQTFAERQVSLFAQALMPSLRQRNPEARQRLLATLADLASGADVLNRLLLKRALSREFEDFPT